MGIVIFKGCWDLKHSKFCLHVYPFNFFHSNSFAFMLLHVQLTSSLSFHPYDWSYSGLGIVNCEMQSGKQQTWQLCEQVKNRLEKEYSQTQDPGNMLSWELWELLSILKSREAMLITATCQSECTWQGNETTCAHPFWKIDLGIPYCFSSQIIDLHLSAEEGSEEALPLVRELYMSLQNFIISHFI